MRAIARGFVKMKDMKYDRRQLLAEVTKNRETHIKEYQEAMEDYRQFALRAVQDAIAGFESELKRLANKEVFVPSTVLKLRAIPESHEKDYDQVIRQLSMGVDDHLMIASDEFACFVMDDWDWKEDFRATAAFYKMSNSK